MYERSLATIEYNEYTYSREDNDDIKLDIISSMDFYFGFPRF